MSEDEFKDPFLNDDSAKDDDDLTEDAGDTDTDEDDTEDDDGDLLWDTEEEE
jgi:hypothetical protein